MKMAYTVKAVKWAQEKQAKVFIVNTAKQVKLFKKAARSLGVKMTIRLPKGGPCFECYENHKDTERDCCPPTDMSSIMPKIVSLKSSVL